MNDDDELLPNQATPASQSTQIEQTRAVAEVQSALTVARMNPRYEIGARAEMRAACAMPALAEAAFFSYPRGGETVSGPSIHLATELARCWGNVDAGIKELSRDDVKGESEMAAYAWDLQTNTRSTTNFLVPHRRNTRKGDRALTDLRDVYENNANMGARRLRECIFRVLPKAFVEEAKAVCMETIQHGGGVPIEKRREQLLEAFAAMDVTRNQIERKAGRAADQLTAFDISGLRVIYGSIKNGELRIAEAFEDDVGVDLTAEITNISIDKKDGEPVAAAGDAPEAVPGQEPWRATYEAAKQAFTDVENSGSLELLKPVYEPHYVAMPETVSAELRGLYATRMAVLLQAETRKK